MRLALLCNERAGRAAGDFPDDVDEEYDSPETLRAIARALEGLGAEVVPVAADRRLPWRLEEGGFDFAFNVAEGAGRRCREAIPATVCELLGIPFTGPDALTLALTLDKALARRVVSPEVPVARAVLWDGAEAGSPAPDPAALAPLAFPVMVKPNDEGSSKGIRSDAIARDARSAAAACGRLFARYGCPVLVEEFLPGAEVTVGVVGNGRDARVLGMMEIAPSGTKEVAPAGTKEVAPAGTKEVAPAGTKEIADVAGSFVYSVDVKRDYRRRVHYWIPPRVSSETRDRIERHALTAYRILGCRDTARMDFRLDAAGEPRFLECNALPGLDPENSDLVILSRPILGYGDLVRGIFLDAARRFSYAVPDRVAPTCGS